MIAVRLLPADRLGLIAEIDRSELLARPPHSGLLAKEPDDIHLVAAIG